MCEGGRKWIRINWEGGGKKDGKPLWVRVGTKSDHFSCWSFSSGFRCEVCSHWKCDKRNNLSKLSDWSTFQSIYEQHEGRHVKQAVGMWNISKQQLRYDKCDRSPTEVSPSPRRYSKIWAILGIVFNEVRIIRIIIIILLKCRDWNAETQKLWHKHLYNFNSQHFFFHLKCEY